MEISLPRGDIRNIKFQVTDNGEPYIDFDEVYFTVKKDYKTSDTLIQKKLSDETIHLDRTTGYFSFRFEPEDTEDLAYKTYVFDIEVVKGTIIKQTTLGNLIITPEVTFPANE